MPEDDVRVHGEAGPGPSRPDRTRLPLDVDTTARPIRPVASVPGSPNVVIVLVDDMGFGASTSYGGPCEMPTAERLADEGLRYSRFHVTPLCSPTRQALMTGRNHHSVGMGVTSEMSTPEPGYHGYRPASAATIAQILSGNGYCTAAIGKWHQTPPVEVSPSGPFQRWPMGEGFDFFYGFMGAEMNHWYPQLYQGRYAVEPDRLPEDGYHLSEDLVDNAIAWVENQQAITPDRPFFTYLALGATHAPFHVAPEWRDKYAGRFDAGWDAQREATLARQKELGIVPDAAELAPWAEGVPHWEELDETEQKVAARFMETYAGFAEHADVQIGRFVDALEELGVLDDTLFFYLLGDNGASGEGGPRGTFREHLVGHGIQDDTADMAARLDTLGDPTTYAIYPAGWALAMNTPYPWTKQVAHLGGTRDGMIVRWGNGIAARGEIRHQWHHVIDVLPDHPRGHRAARRPGRSAGSSSSPSRAPACATPSTTPHAPERHTTQYFEMIGNRGVYHEGWTAVTRHGVPWEMVGHAQAALRGGRLGALRPRGRLEPGPRPRRPAARAAARAPGGLPARGGEARRAPAGRPGHRAGEPRGGRSPRPPPGPVVAQLRAAGRAAHRGGGTQRQEPLPRHHRRPRGASSGANGVVVAQGGRFGGWSLYLVGGVPHYAYNFVGRDLTVVRGAEPMEPGRHDLVVAVRLRRRPARQRCRGAPRGGRRTGRHRPDPGDHGLLLLLRRDLQRRGGPRHAGGRRLPAGAQPVRGADPPGAVRPRADVAEPRHRRGAARPRVT